MGITDRSMSTAPAATDTWVTESFGKGHGALLARITPAGARAFYYRYTGTKGQVRLPIGPYSRNGDGAATYTVAQARAKALEWSAMRGNGVVVDLREHLEQLDADRLLAAELERQRVADEQRRRE